MKALLVFSAFFILSAAHASNLNSSYREIPSSSMSIYIEALRVASVGRTITCEDGRNYDLKGSVDAIPVEAKLYVTTAGQPAIVAKFHNGLNKVEYSFSTTSDLKEIAVFSFKSFETKRLNTGTLVEPSFNDVEIPVTTGSCTVIK